MLRRSGSDAGIRSGALEAMDLGFLEANGRRVTSPNSECIFSEDPSGAAAVDEIAPVRHIGCAYADAGRANCGTP